MKSTRKVNKIEPMSPINWDADAMLRRRFANADAEIAPDDKYTKEYFEKLKKEKDE
jgi:hypothetical protein|tara:strand:- start:280 stop:447 length:168 start_codon:yes stop_codon:yes gene_type:complete